MARIPGSDYHHDAQTDTHWITIPIGGILYEQLRQGMKVDGTLRLVEVEPMKYELQLTRLP
jgi:hypothetical protein